MKLYVALTVVSLFSALVHAEPKIEPADLAVITYDGMFVDRDGMQTTAALNISKVDRATVSFDLMVQHFPFHGCLIDGHADLQDDGTFVFVSTDVPQCKIRILPTAAAVHIEDIDDRCQPIYCGFSGYIGTTVIPRTSMSSSDEEYDSLILGLTR